MRGRVPKRGLLRAGMAKPVYAISHNHARGTGKKKPTLIPKKNFKRRICIL
jgi:hypothetical protein